MNRLKQKPLHIVSIVFAALLMPALVQAGELVVDLSYQLESGSYGSDSTTDVTTIPLVLKYYENEWSRNFQRISSVGDWKMDFYWCNAPSATMNICLHSVVKSEASVRAAERGVWRKARHFWPMRFLPEQPIRQWVLSFPFQLRFLFASRPELMGRVLGHCQLAELGSAGVV